MGNLLYTFKRYEKKYLVTREQFHQFVERCGDRLIPDEYGCYSIRNLYYDNDYYELIRASISKPFYKEKFRVRSYGNPKNGSVTFAEIKKKCDGIVYKRRISGTYDEIMSFLAGQDIPDKAPVSCQEIRQFFKRYQPIPKVYISYDRNAYVLKENPSIRLTFDQNIAWRTNDLDLQTETETHPLTDSEQMIFELKTDSGIPMWLSNLLSNLNIFPGSFSKYGTCYTNYLIKESEEKIQL